jgi:GTP-binding protein
VRAGEDRSFVIADLPGLIPGAAEGKGLGHRFLRHTERTRLLVHLIDLDPSTGRDPLADYRAIQDELHAYSEELASRPQIVVVNKIELPDTAAAREAVERFCAGRGLPFHAVSAITGDGLPALVHDMARRLASEPWIPAAR